MDLPQAEKDTKLSRREQKKRAQKQDIYQAATALFRYTILNCGMCNFSDSLVERIGKAARIFVTACTPPPTKG
jgi:hypothetical protein